MPAQKMKKRDQKLADKEKEKAQKTTGKPDIDELKNKFLKKK